MIVLAVILSKFDWLHHRQQFCTVSVLSIMDNELANHQRSVGGPKAWVTNNGSNYRQVTLSRDAIDLNGDFVGLWVKFTFCTISRSLFERATGAGMPMAMLVEQYRMHPDICKVVSKLFYGGRVKTGDATLRRRAVFNPALTWVDVQVTSKENSAD